MGLLAALLMTTGSVFIVAGTAMIFPPAAWIVGGILVALCGVGSLETNR